MNNIPTLKTLLQHVDVKSIRDMDVAFAQFIQQLDQDCDALEVVA